MKAEAKVSQLINSNGNSATNQFIIESETKEGNKTKTFQSYETTIAVLVMDDANFGVVETIMDTEALNYSKTTSKHLFIFLGLNRKNIEKIIKAVSILLRDLN
jgi:hypothetical protein